MASSSSQNFTRPRMTVDEMKTLITTDIQEDTLLQAEISTLIEKVQQKRRWATQQIQQIQAKGRPVSMLECQYFTYLQEKINREKVVIENLWSAGHTLGDQCTWGEVYKENCGENKTVDQVKCPEYDPSWPKPWYVTDFENQGR